MKHLIIVFLIANLISLLNTAQAQIGGDQISPSTVKATVEWLSFKENELLCKQKKSLVAHIRIVKVKGSGSGLVAMLQQDDTIAVALKVLGDSRPLKGHQQECILSEQPCFSGNDAFYTIFYARKED